VAVGYWQSAIDVFRQSSELPHVSTADGDC
jgi:hypothetical protein